MRMGAETKPETSLSRSVIKSKERSRSKARVSGEKDCGLIKINSESEQINSQASLDYNL